MRPAAVLIVCAPFFAAVHACGESDDANAPGSGGSSDASTGGAAGAGGSGGGSGGIGGIAGAVDATGGADAGDAGNADAGAAGVAGAGLDAGMDANVDADASSGGGLGSLCNCPPGQTCAGSGSGCASGLTCVGHYTTSGDPIAHCATSCFSNPDCANCNCVYVTVNGTPLGGWCMPGGSCGVDAGPLCPPPTGNPELLYSGSGVTRAVHADGTNLYFGELGSPNWLIRKPIAGGTAEKLGWLSSANDITVAAGNIYIADQFGLRKVAANAAPTSGFVPEVSSINAGFVAVDSTHVYAGWQSTYKLALSNDSATVLVTSNQFMGGLAVYGSDVYFTRPFSSEILRVDKAGIDVDAGQAPTLVATLPGARSIAVDASGIYVASIQAGKISRLDPSGQNPVDLTPADGPMEIALDGTALYWVQHGTGQCGGAIAKVSTTGGSAVVLAGGLANPSSLSISGGYVYFTDDDMGTVRRIAK